MKKIFFLTMCFFVFLSCTPVKKNVDLSERVPASEVDSISSEIPRLVYSSYLKNVISNEEINIERWSGLQNGFSSGGREDYLIKMYYANTVGISSRGLLHSACFFGNAQAVKKLFFDAENKSVAVRNLSKPVQTKASSDGRRLGIKLNHARRGNLFFRLGHCLSGKSTLADSVGKTKSKPVRIPSNEASEVSAKAETGFLQLHKARINPKQYPEFKLKADFEKIPAAITEKPWRGLNLRDPKEALLFSLLAQKYFYEDMANQNVKKNDFNFIAANSNRYWCHMPWLNTGVYGREAIHGLTQERDLRSSTSIPAFKNTTPGTNWGVAYFNAEGCRTIQDVFGSESQPKAIPEFDKGVFWNETFIAKILFTTAKFPEIENSYTWNAHVSEVGSTDRTIRKVKHIQMDIAVKDSSLRGVSPALNNWVMTGFYYDETYDYDKEYKELLGGLEFPIKSVRGLPKELLKMRPIGVQTGYDNPSTMDTIVFPGSFTNGAGNRLNGPADNPRTSCLGCHGAAGTQAKMVPGFLSMNMYQPYKDSVHLDFNQQLALAKANYETFIP